MNQFIDALDVSSTTRPAITVLSSQSEIYFKIRNLSHMINVIGSAKDPRIWRNIYGIVITEIELS